MNSKVDGDPAFEQNLDTISEYAPHSITRNILNDRNGNIWLASWEGSFVMMANILLIIL
ncbi:MAG: hypothetical protein IPF75_18375 [Bacteroidetes bacterium]|nr:hypothetical protein [Bacteroidota bacterium]